MKWIKIRGAKQHNLKNINLDIPCNQITVITGLSGSGKSSLAFDTIYAEGQRRYINSLSTYARQFFDQLERPKVDSIEGLSPAICVDQKVTSNSLRSTVGTTTEIYDYLRLLYSSIGKPHCPQCGQSITIQSVEQIATSVLASPQDTRVMVLAPIVRGRKGEFKKELDKIQKQGFTRVRIDGVLKSIDEESQLNKKFQHSIEIVIDRLLIKKDAQKRLTDSIQTAINLADGLVQIAVIDGDEKLFSQKMACPKCEINISKLEPRSFSFNSSFGACAKCNGLGFLESLEENTPSTCDLCNGKRLCAESLAIRINEKGIGDIVELSIADLKKWFDSLKFSSREQKIVSNVLKEIDSRFSFLLEVGLEYLCLERLTSSLSSGEKQRVQLATQIGSKLRGVLYVLDEPTIGLHPRDNSRLLDSIKKLRDLGNTVITVEHDEEAILQADYVVELGPGAGSSGGNIIAVGTPTQILENEQSPTGDFLSKRKSVSILKSRKPQKDKCLSIKGATQNNLKNINVKFPIGIFNVVTGVSGSGKSTLVIDILSKALSQKIYKNKSSQGIYSELSGYDQIDNIIEIDQSPIGRTSRSNPATYTGIFTFIRELYSTLPEAREKGYKSNRFSFNTKGGRCDNCDGDGYKQIEMKFLPDVSVLCDICLGKRYNQDTLTVKYHGYSIADVLDTTITDAVELFTNIPAVKNKLQVILDIGLGYLKLGQSSTTLSGGEAQRIKLAKELSRRSTGKTVYILDEPTRGLHFEDVGNLIKILQRLVDAGNTVIAIEHNLDFIKSADWILDLGPEGGEKGGYIVGQGTPKGIAKIKNSYTGQILSKV